jgi:lipopolysaccharide export system permease protein
VVLSRYIFREFLGHWLATSIALSLLVLANQLTRALDRAAEANLPSDVVASITLLSFVSNAGIVLPLSLLLAIVLTYGRLAQDGEMAAIRASGIGTWQSARGIGVFAVVLSLGLAWISLAWAPQLSARQQQTLDDAYRRAQLAAFNPGRFTQLPGTGIVIHVGAIAPDGGLRDLVFLQRAERELEVITARNASYSIDAASSMLNLEMRSGVRLQGEAGVARSQRVTFERLRTQVPLPNVERKRLSRDAIPSADLLQSNRRDDQAEVQWRWSIPVMCALLALIALPLSQLRPRQGRYARVAPALLLFFLYINLLAAARSAIGRGTLAIWPGMGWVHMGIALLAICYFGLPYWRRRRRRSALAIAGQAP